MREHEHRPSRPSGLYAIRELPSGVRVNDHVYLDGAYRRVVDMRAVGPRGKVLIFADNTTWRMRRQHLIFRPILPFVSGE
ncbi:hypothetical protein SBI_04881 [Streptomyces bingchenggensis BCW-1]|uniref:Uncharacterized protein n=1 Tax=Streptomyces bingchenggensis (strain BCW-1) TaxID=749414 RepID=D7C1A0_STRBB|nr:MULTISPECIES: hypothetical protein [Streptomyces]ADI08001.1 hypothetical protein SBI_04881 [Streptomyces bingchenggensis BCW-1]